LEISFETKALRDLCEDDALAAQKLGFAAAEALMHRLADIRAAVDIRDVQAGRPQPGRYMAMDCYRFELADGLHLTVLPNHTPAREDASGNADWALIRRVRVVSWER
jgi:hypothetical protein